METSRRGFLKALGTLLTGSVLIPNMSLEESKAVADEVNKGFPEYSSDPQPLPVLGPEYRWCTAANLETRLNQGYRFVGVKPIIFGGSLVLMKKVKL